MKFLIMYRMSQMTYPYDIIMANNLNEARDVLIQRYGFSNVATDKLFIIRQLTKQDQEFLINKFQESIIKLRD
jgi:hypothetical protein